MTLSLKTAFLILLGLLVAILAPFGISSKFQLDVRARGPLCRILLDYTNNRRGPV